MGVGDALGGFTQGMLGGMRAAKDIIDLKKDGGLGLPPWDSGKSRAKKVGGDSAPDTSTLTTPAVPATSQPSLAIQPGAMTPVTDVTPAPAATVAGGASDGFASGGFGLPPFPGQQAAPSGGAGPLGMGGKKPVAPPSVDQSQHNGSLGSILDWLGKRFDFFSGDSK